MRGTSVKLHDDTFEAVRRRAEQRGMNSSEYIRQAVEAQLAMELVADAIQEGGDPQTIADPRARAAALGEAAKLIRRRRTRKT